MNCLVEFLMDGYQKKLIEMVQNREETFEQALQSYKMLFVKELEHCVGRKLGETVELKDAGCPCRCNDVHCMHIEVCKHFYKTICEIEEAEIEYFFDTICACYFQWIDGKATRALEAFGTLMQEYGLITLDKTDKNLCINDVNKQVLFRARLSDSFLSKLEIFHVPFNKRYNIRNERFSLTGQPVLYLGNSIADLLEELNVDDLDSEQLSNLRVASFEFKKKFDIFDLRCNIFHDLKHVKLPTFTKKKFYRNILALICNFQKRRELADCAFTEEYVIPQMLSQVLKQNGYEGICYYSTKAFENYHIDCRSDRWLMSELNMAYRENYAIFTHMNGRYEFDKVLRENMEISMPVSLGNIRICTEEDLKEVINTFGVEAEEAQKALQKGIDKELNGKILGNYAYADSIVKYYEYVFHKLRYKNVKYSKTNIGQVQIQLLLGILNRLLVSNIDATMDGETETETKIDATLEKNRMVIPCEIDGTENEAKEYGEVHRNGNLHKAYLGFVCSGRDIIIENDTIQGAFYEHSKAALSEGKYDFTQGHDIVKSVGSFFYRSYEAIATPDLYGSYIENNFELIEVLVMHVGENEALSGERKGIEKYKNDFVQSYDSLHPLLKQALPLLFDGLSAD